MCFIEPEKGMATKAWENIKGATQYPAIVAENISRFLVNAAGVTVEWATELFLSVPVGIAKGIYDRLQGKPELIQSYLRKAVDFCKTAPGAMVEWVAGIFTEEKIDSPDTLANLMNVGQWIMAFQDIDFDEPILGKDTLVPGWGPSQYLKTLSPEQRRDRFASLAIAVIPQDAREGFTMFDKTEPDDLRNVLAESPNKTTLVDTMQKMFGMQKKDFSTDSSDSAKLARESLRQRFFLIQKGNADPDTNKLAASEGLNNAFRDHLERRPGRLTLAGITERTGNKDPLDSLLLGAVKGGVLTQADITKFVLPKIDQKNIDIQEKSNQQRRVLEETTRASRDELRRGAETMTERFDKAPGFMKLAIVLGIIGGVMKFPKTSAAVAAFFAGKYFLLKDNNPLDSTGNNLMTALAFLRGKSALPQIGNAQAVKQLGEEVIAFLPDRAKEDINTSVTGFTLLAGLDMHLIATHFEPTRDGRMGTLRAWDQPLKTAIKGSLKTRQMDTAAANRFFPSGDPRSVDADGNPTESVDCTKNRNLCETGDALASVFFLIGQDRVRSGSQTNTSLDMGTLGLIEQARTDYTESGLYDHIGDDVSLRHPQRSEQINIREAFYQVVLEGMNEAQKMGPGVTLEQILRQLAAKPQVRPSEAQPTESKDRFAFLQHELEDYEDSTGQRVAFKIEKNTAGDVVMDLQDTSFPSPITVTFKEFIQADKKRIVLEWLSHANLKKKEDMVKAVMANPMIRHAYGLEFSVQQSAFEKVRFVPMMDVGVPGTMPVAESTIYKFLKTDPQTILQKYETYEKNVSLGTVKPGTDPL